MGVAHVCARNLPAEPDPRITAIPRTIDAIGEALGQPRRAEFLTAVTGARQGQELDDIMATWWMEAMFESVPDRNGRLADSVAGSGLSELPHLREDDQ